MSCIATQAEFQSGVIMKFNQIKPGYETWSQRAPFPAQQCDLKKHTLNQRGVRTVINYIRNTYKVT